MINLKSIFNIYDYYYYSKSNGCNAPNSRHNECICWHKVGTGPNKHVKALEDLPIAFVYNTEKKIKLSWKKKLSYFKLFRATLLPVLISIAGFAALTL